MKFEFNERNSREFYDELLYIAAYHKRIYNKPYKKVKEYTKFLIGESILSVISIIVCIIFYCIYEELLFSIAVGIFLVSLIYYLKYYFSAKNRLDTFMNEKGNVVVEINKDGISFKDKNREIKDSWDDIFMVLINKYTICVMPKSLNGTIISLSVDNKDKVIDGINKYKKDLLIVDNSNLYK